MNERKRLIALLDAATSEFRFDSWENTDKIADYLLANGVTLQPVKMGDTIYRVCSKGTRHRQHVKRYKVSPVNYYDVMENFGKTVFLTEKEAKAAIAKGAKNEKQHTAL